MAEREIKIRLSASDVGASSVIDGLKNKIQALKNVAGGRSDLKDVFEILKGGGAIAGASFGASFLRDAAAGAKDMAEQLATGKMHAADIPERLAQAVPIFGSLYNAAKDFGLVVTGIATDMAKWSQEADRIDRIFKSNKESIGTTADFVKQQARQQAELRGADPTTLKISDQAAAIDAAIAKQTKEKTPQIMELEKAARDAQAKVSAMRDANRNASSLPSDEYGRAPAAPYSPKDIADAEGEYAAAQALAAGQRKLLEKEIVDIRVAGEGTIEEMLKKRRTDEQKSVDDNTEKAMRDRRQTEQELIKSRLDFSERMHQEAVREQNARDAREQQERSRVDFIRGALDKESQGAGPQIRFAQAVEVGPGYTGISDLLRERASAGGADAKSTARNTELMAKGIAEVAGLLQRILTNGGQAIEVQ